MARDFKAIRKHAYTRANRMFEAFDRRKDLLLEVAREWNPLLVPGLELGVEQIADGWKFDDDHRMLTTVPLTLLRKSAGGFLANMMSPSRPWFDFQISNSGIEASHEELLALNEFKAETERSFQQSNAYAAGYKIFEHLLCVGFGCMLVNANAEGEIFCETLRIGTYALDIDDVTGRVNRVARRFAWTPEYILHTFGEEWTPESIKELVKKGSTKRVEIWNLIEPNPQGFDRKFDPLEKDGNGITDERNAYRSIYFLKGAGSSGDKSGDRYGDKCGILRMTGFLHNPIVAPRLDYEQGDVYGLGRCIDGLYNARGVQTFRGDTLRITGLRGQPPVVVTGDFKNRVQLGRKGVNIVKNGDQASGKVVPVFTQLPDAKDTRDSFYESKAELEELLYVDALAVIDAQKNNPGVKTATEIEYLKTENLSKLGAIYINLSNEMFDPIVRTIANYTFDAPNRLKDEAKETLIKSGVLNGFQVEYVSAIAIAQKAGALTSIQQYVQFCGNMGAMDQSVSDNLNKDKTLRLVGRMLNVPEEVNNDEKEVEKIRAARAAAAEQQAQMAQAAEMAAAAKQIGDIPIDENHLGGGIAEGLKG